MFLFDTYMSEKIYSKERMVLLLDELEKINPDVICLQEVTKPLLLVLLSTSWIKKNYFVTCSDNGTTIQPYGVWVATKYVPKKIEMHKESNGKIFSYLLFSSISCGDFMLVNIHLNSDLSTDFLQKRKKQLDYIFNQVHSTTSVMIVGDFNFGDEENDNYDFHSYNDLWLTMHPKDPGFTYDPSINSMAKITSKSQRNRRLDRVLLKSPKIKCDAIKLVGTNPTQIQNPSNKNETVTIFPSDHFGLEILFNFPE